MKRTKSNLSFHQNVLKSSTGFVLVGSFLLFLLFRSQLSIGLGFLLGGLVSLLNFYLLCKTAQKSIEMHPEGAKRYTLLNYILRYAIYGLTLYVGGIILKWPILSVAIGLFSVKIIILIRQIVGRNI